MSVMGCTFAACFEPSLFGLGAWLDLKTGVVLVIVGPFMVSVGWR